jgi:hypothetical protein
MHGEAELTLGLEPCRVEIVTGLAQVGQDVEEILPHSMGQHEAVMQRGAPAHELAIHRLTPEHGGQGADQQLLGKAHARLGRHFETAEFDKAQTPGGAIGLKNLSMQISVRWVLPVTSTSRLRSRRSVIHASGWG